jgi:RimJ/RimL family protein N-acetyltransferase
MDAAIGFSRDAESLRWLDLRVFAHNARARALYRSLGFEEVGTLRDRFRIGEVSIDDVIMTLRVG